jgi:tetratricopeptide (TPR) repeat protein
MKWSRIPILLVTLLLFGSVLAQEERVRSLTDEAEVAKLRFAASQHEIIAIHLQEGSYEAAVSEYKAILALGLRDVNEGLLVREAWQIALSLNEAKQYDLAFSVVDDTLASVRTNENKFTLLMLKGKTLKEAGRLKEAVKVYRQAQELQE